LGGNASKGCLPSDLSASFPGSVFPAALPPPVFRSDGDGFVFAFFVSGWCWRVEDFFSSPEVFTSASGCDIGSTTGRGRLCVGKVPLGRERSRSPRKTSDIRKKRCSLVSFSTAAFFFFRSSPCCAAAFAASRSSSPGSRMGLAPSHLPQRGEPQKQGCLIEPKNLWLS